MGFTSLLLNDSTTYQSKFKYLYWLGDGLWLKNVQTWSIGLNIDSESMFFTIGKSCSGTNLNDTAN